MTQWIKIALIIALLTIVGCNETKIDPINDIEGASINQYGYYGDNIIFGTSKIVSNWIIFDKLSDYSIKINLKVDANVTQNQDYNVKYGKYGVSIDGKVLNTNILSPQTQLSYIQTLNDYTIINNQDGTKSTLACINIDLYISFDEEHKDLIMCPFNSI